MNIAIQICKNETLIGIQSMYPFIFAVYFNNVFKDSVVRLLFCNEIHLLFTILYVPFFRISIFNKFVV